MNSDMVKPMPARAPAPASWSPGVFSGLHGQTEFHGESRSGDQSQWFADRQADHDREHDRLMAEKRAGGNCNAGIGESE